MYDKLCIVITQMSDGQFLIKENFTEITAGDSTQVLEFLKERLESEED